MYHKTVLSSCIVNLIAAAMFSIFYCSSSESGSVEGNLDDEMYLTNDSGITEDEPATLEEGLLYITKVNFATNVYTCIGVIFLGQDAKF